MLILTCKLGNEIINCYDGTHNKEQLKKWSSKKILLCPVCGKPYEYCHGKIKTPYFRHMDKNECEDRFSEPETNEHLNGKRDLFEWVKKQDGVTNAVLEGWIPKTKQRPDIMFEYGGQKYVIEYQCSPIATEYVERHDLYKASGIIDIWIAGYEKYFKSNSRHKYLEDYIEGYYNPSTKLFRISNCTEQGKFINKVNVKSSSFFLYNFIFQNSSIVYKTYKDKKFDDLYRLHMSRKVEKDNATQKERIEIEKRISSISKYVTKFNGTFGKYHYYSNRDKTIYYLYGNSKSDFYKRNINTDKKGFYKRIFDIKENIETARKLDELFCNYINDNWSFYACASNDGISINVCLLDTFMVTFTINHSNVNINNEDSIKKMLLPYMNLCLENGMRGNYSMRVMEVIN